MKNLEYVTVSPKEMGISPEAIGDTLNDIRITKGLELHSFLMARKGHLVTEEYFVPEERENLHVMYSVTKSFMSTAMGIAQGEDLFSIEDKVYDFFPEYRHLCDSEEKRHITLAHLLMMGSGFENRENDIFGHTQNYVETALAQRVIHEPGKVFNYYTLGSHLLSAVFQKVCPEGLHSYLRRKVFDPMGIGETRWEKDPMGIDIGGFGLFIRAIDMVKFGQLYLQRGKWQGEALIPEDYVLEATGYRIDNQPSGNPHIDWQQGYGYQFWRCSFGAYRADGMQGQYIVVMPEKEAVITMTGRFDNMQIPLTAIAERLLPGMV